MASLATLVQFVRNAACNVKTFARWLPADLNREIVPARGARGSVRGAVTVNELAVISPTQFMATAFNLKSGVEDVYGGVADVLRFTAWVRELPAGSGKRGGAPSDAENIVYTGIRQSLTSAYLRILQGLIQLSFAVSFAVLGLNSLRGLGFFDGAQGQKALNKLVIDALVVMDVGLVYFLWVLWSKYAEHSLDSTRCDRLAFLLDDGSTRSRSVVDLAQDAGYAPSSLPLAYSHIMPREHVPLWQQADVEPSRAALRSAVGEIEDNLDSFEEQSRSPAAGSSAAAAISSAKQLRSDAAYKLRLLAYEGGQSAPTDLAFFVLNVIAGYGYLLGILRFYFPESKRGPPALWHWVLKFGLSHADSDWWGNLAGDTAWTIEPLLVMFTAGSFSGLWSTSASSSGSGSGSPSKGNGESKVRFAATSKSQADDTPRGRLSQAPTPWKDSSSAKKGRSGSSNSRSRSPAARSRSPGKRSATPKSKK